jgi:hypothetical protein
VVPTPRGAPGGPARAPPRRPARRPPEDRRGASAPQAKAAASRTVPRRVARRTGGGRGRGVQSFTGASARRRWATAARDWLLCPGITVPACSARPAR